MADAALTATGRRGARESRLATSGLVIDGQIRATQTTALTESRPSLEILLAQLLTDL